MSENPKRFKIEKNVPLPPLVSTRKKRQGKYPFDEMIVGDSFFVSGAKEAVIRQATYAWKRKNRDDSIFSVRPVDGGIRVWKIS